MEVTVVGAGVSGLTTALRLAEAGHRVTVLTAEPPLQTTSAVAAALWYPYRALPHDAVTRWSARSFAVFAELAGVPDAGVRLTHGRELFRSSQPDPWWRDAVPDLARVPPDELPPGYVDGYLLTVPVADTTVYLPWLAARLRSHGVAVEQRALATLADAPGDVVVNCAGLGAAPLAHDDTLTPVRGQVVVVTQVGVHEWLLDQADAERLTYVVPRASTVVLGGTAQVGDRRTEPDDDTAREIVQRCARLVPALAGADVVAHKVGLRPARPAVHVAPAALPDGRPLMHNYGHGGAGVTLSWGCADDVVALVRAA